MNLVCHVINSCDDKITYKPNSYPGELFNIAIYLVPFSIWLYSVFLLIDAIFWFACL